MFERLKAARNASAEKAELRRLLADCDELIKERGQSVSVGIGARVISRFNKLSSTTRHVFYDELNAKYNPNTEEIEAALESYKSSKTSENLVRITRASEPPRQELLRRINRVPHGTLTIVTMRRELIARMKSKPELLAADADFEHLLSSWFNPGFLELKKLDWTSPAYLLEQVIRHEAVHAIDGWSDLHRRLEPDRRLFAYFHPALPGEPLIFVEVALVEEMPNAIAVLLDRSNPPNLNKKSYKVATFYSISNCQPGLKGIHLGNFLIKRVAEELKKEFPSIRTFCTLSPIPTFTEFLTKKQVWSEKHFTVKKIEQLKQKSTRVLQRYSSSIKSGSALNNDDLMELKELCAAYLAQTSSEERTESDPVARFHLNNGAILDRINTDADLSSKGLRQSYGLMVNYRYELQEVEQNHESFVAGRVVMSNEIKKLIR